MNHLPSESAVDRSIRAARWIDELCDQFEEAWKRGPAPKIEEYLANRGEADRQRLTSELIMLEVCFRSRAGEEIPIEAYARRFPEFSAESLEALIQMGQTTPPRASLRRGEECTVALGNNASDTRVSIPLLQNFGIYESLEQIGRGGMGVVYKGRDTDLQRDIAVKVLLKHHQAELDLQERFVEEAQIAGQLQHPGIAPIYQFGKIPDGRPYFSMKFIKGETLAKQLSLRASPQENRPRFLKIFEQLCQTLAFAHSRRVIHRDLKPANVMVGAFGEVQLMDWGLAKVLTEDGPKPTPSPPVSIVRTARSGSRDQGGSSGSQTQFGSMLGTPAYMAPEQALGETLDERADVFGLGAILCEILTGRPPYVAAEADVLRRKAIRADLSEALESLQTCGADEELLGLARRALAPEPNGRPADAGVVAAEVTAYLEGVDARLRQAELAEAQAKTRAIEERIRRRLALTFSSVLLAIFIGGIIGTTYGLVSARAAQEMLGRELYVVDTQLASQHLESITGTGKTVAELLAKQIPAAGQPDRREFSWRLLWTEINKNALVLKGHRGGAKALAFADHKTLLTVDGKQAVRRWNLNKGELVPGEIPPLSETASCWALSADAKLLALGTDKSVEVFDAQSGHSLHKFPGTEQALVVNFSTNGNHLAAAWDNGRLETWDLKTRKSTSYEVAYTDQYSALEQLEISLDGKDVFLADYPKNGLVTRVHSGQSESVYPKQHDSAVFSIALSSTGQWRATGDSNGQVVLTSDGEEEGHSVSFQAHRGVVSALAFSPDESRLATGGADGTIYIWEVATRKHELTLKGHQARIHALRFSPTGQTLASACDDTTVRVWNLVTHQTSRVLGSHQMPVFSIAFSPNGKRIAVGTGLDELEKDGVVKVWEYKGPNANPIQLETDKLVSEFSAGKGRVMALGFIDRERLVTGGYDSRLQIWDPETGQPLPDVDGKVAPEPNKFKRSTISSLAIGSKGDFIVAGVGHPTYHVDDYAPLARVLSLPAAREIKTLSGHKNVICDLALSPNGEVLATASDDHTIKLWSTHDWQPTGKGTIKAGTERLKCLRFSRDGKFIVAGAESGTVIIWEVASGDLIQELHGHADAAYRLEFSPDGKTLATASWDNTVKLWDITCGREIRTLREHKNWISCLAFSPDGHTLATGSFDATVRLWEATPLDQITAEIETDKNRSAARK